MGSGILGPLAPLLTIIVFATVPAYPVAQIWVLFRRQGWSLWLSIVPVFPMAIVLALTVHWHQAGSNLFPLLLIFASPVALLWLWLSGFVRGGD